MWQAGVDNVITDEPRQLRDARDELNGASEIQRLLMAFRYRVDR
jgi:hypothetical protein